VQDATREDDSQNIDMSTLATSIIIAIFFAGGSGGKCTDFGCNLEKDLSKDTFS